MEALLPKQVTLGTFPSRLAAGHLLREVLHEGEVPRTELLRRVERFSRLAVLRPDGYLAWARTGRTQQKVGQVAWRDEAFRAGPFELGRFYAADGGVFRPVDARLEPVATVLLAEVYDDADYLGRTLDGAEAAYVKLALSLGQLFSRPAESLAALKHLPSGLAALIASSPAYFERFRYMSRGEQVQALSELATTVIVTWGTASGTTRTLAGSLAGAETSVPVLSLTADCALVMERLAIPIGRTATVLGGGPGAAIILQRARTGASGSSPSDGPGQWGPADEYMSERARAYQAQITGHSADEVYWVGGVGRINGGVKFDGFLDGFLLEAKGPGYANKFLDNLEPKLWFRSSGAKSLVDQARRQLRAAEGSGCRIRWHIAEPKTTEAIQLLFKNERVHGIEVVYTPSL